MFETNVLFLVSVFETTVFFWYSHHRLGGALEAVAHHRPGCDARKRVKDILIKNTSMAYCKTYSVVPEMSAGRTHSHCPAKKPYRIKGIGGSVNSCSRVQHL